MFVLHQGMGQSEEATVPVIPAAFPGEGGHPGPPQDPGVLQREGGSEDSDVWMVWAVTIVREGVRAPEGNRLGPREVRVERGTPSPV